MKRLFYLTAVARVIVLPSMPASEAAAGQGGRRCAFWRTVAATAALAWLLCAACAVLGTRSFNRLDRRYGELVYEDLADEVTARMGPHWHETFFGDVR